ncbi:hypothetical protein L345_06388, partial [Ophiophagus hannah]
MDKIYKRKSMNCNNIESCKPSPPQKPLPANPQKNKAVQFNPASRTMFELPKPMPQIAPVRLVWLSLSMFHTKLLMEAIQVRFYEHHDAQSCLILQ